MRWHQLCSAPGCCGLYAWYYVPRISEKNAETQESILSCLAASAAKLRFPELELELSGHLSLSFRGGVEHDHLGRHQLEKLSTVGRILDSHAARLSLARMLHQTVPMFAAPLYIGVSVNLARRLGQHRRLILGDAPPDVSATVDGENAKARDCSFGAAIRDRRIDPNHLRVQVQPYVEDIPSGPDAREFIEGVESILNRLYYPILGRR